MAGSQVTAAGCEARRYSFADRARPHRRAFLLPGKALAEPAPELASLGVKENPQP